MGTPETIPQLERWLEELTRRWERFFAHDPKVPLPPERERTALEHRLRDLSRAESHSTVENFRLEQLLHRFMLYNQLWQRQLREREEARGRAGQAEREARALNVAAAETVPSVDGGYETLHRAYLAALQAAGSTASVNFNRFRDTLERQRQQLEERGVSVEGYDVVQEGTQVKVKARVRREKS